MFSHTLSTQCSYYFFYKIYFTENIQDAKVDISKNTKKYLYFGIIIYDFTLTLVYTIKMFLFFLSLIQIAFKILLQSVTRIKLKFINIASTKLL